MIPRNSLFWAEVDTLRRCLEPQLTFDLYNLDTDTYNRKLYFLVIDCCKGILRLTYISESIATDGILIFILVDIGFYIYFVYP